MCSAVLCWAVRVLCGAEWICFSLTRCGGLEVKILGRKMLAPLRLPAVPSLQPAVGLVASGDLGAFSSQPSPPRAIRFTLEGGLRKPATTLSPCSFICHLPSLSTNFIPAPLLHSDGASPRSRGPRALSSPPCKFWSLLIFAGHPRNRGRRSCQGKAGQVLLPEQWPRRQLSPPSGSATSAAAAEATHPDIATTGSNNVVVVVARPISEKDETPGGEEDAPVAVLVHVCVPSARSKGEGQR